MVQDWLVFDRLFYGAVCRVDRYKHHDLVFDETLFRLKESCGTRKRGPSPDVGRAPLAPGRLLQCRSLTKRGNRLIGIVPGPAPEG